MTGTAVSYQKPSEILRNLIRFDTTNPPGNEAACLRYVMDLLAEGGIGGEILALEENRANLLARLPGRGEAPPLLFYGHVDVVTTADQRWTHPPFEGILEDGYVWGRGALDMKGGVAMMLAAMLRAKSEGLVPAGDLILALVADEEAGGDFGAKYLVENHPGRFEDVRYAVGEFGGFSMKLAGKKFYPLAVNEKQACWMKAVVRGPGGHGSQIMRGGTMARLADLLTALDRTPLPIHVTEPTRLVVEGLASAVGFPKGMILRQLLNPKRTERVLRFLGDQGKTFEPMLRHTVNATVVRGGHRTNVIPSEIELQLDGRLLPGFKPHDMLRELKAVTGPDVDLEVVHYDPGPENTDMGLFDCLKGVLKELDPAGIPIPLLMTGVSDARFFARLGIQTYGFLPMNLPDGFDFIKRIHAEDERIPAESVDFGADAMFRLLRRYPN